MAAAMRVQRVSLANIGRMMEGRAKHQIKRCWRFRANDLTSVNYRSSTRGWIVSKRKHVSRTRVRMNAKRIETYKKVNKRMHPTWTEILEIVNQLGYRKVEKRKTKLAAPEPDVEQA